jgi:hypothetical protein
MSACDHTSPSRRKGRRLRGAKTRAGGCCQVRAEPGKARCRFHGGKSTGPKTQAGRARIAEVQRLRWLAYREMVRAVTGHDEAGSRKLSTCWPQNTSLHRNTTASDAITRLWQGDPARQSASVRERQVDVMNLHHRQLIEAALIGLEAIGRTEAHSEIAMKYQPKRFPTVVAPHRFRMR